MSILLIAYGFFVVNFLFGVMVGSGMIDNSRIRPLHHLLYFCAVVSLIAVVVVEVIGGLDIRWMALPMIALLLAMPFFRGGSRGHAIYASFCLAVYTFLILL